MTVSTRTSLLTSKGILYGLGLAGLWLVLALASPTTTYHLAPLLVAGTPAMALSLDGDSSMTRLTTHGLAGLVAALVVTGALTLAGGLEGPSMLPIGGAAFESVVFATVGAVAGLVGGSLIIRR